MELVNWLDKFDLDFACMYIIAMDNAGHDFGPEGKVYFRLFLI